MCKNEHCDQIWDAVYTADPESALKVMWTYPDGRPVLPMEMVCTVALTMFAMNKDAQRRLFDRLAPIAETEARKAGLPRVEKMPKEEAQRIWRSMWEEIDIGDPKKALELLRTRRDGRQRTPTGMVCAVAWGFLEINTQAQHRLLKRLLLLLKEERREVAEAFGTDS